MSEENKHGMNCIACGSDNIRATVRGWAVCRTCSKGMTQGEAMHCSDWCDDCMEANERREAVRYAALDELVQSAAKTVAELKRALAPYMTAEGDVRDEDLYFYDLTHSRYEEGAWGFVESLAAFSESGPDRRCSTL